MANKVIGVEVNKKVFLEEVEKEFLTSAVVEAVKTVVQDVKLKNYRALMQDIPKIIRAAGSAVEVVKQKYISQAISETGDVTIKFDKELAVKTGAKILDDFFKFNGFVGSIFEMFDEDVFALCLSTFVIGQPKNWTGDAVSILAGEKV